MFNPTIADYIYSLEQSQAGAGVAWFRQYFPEDYYPYSANTLQSVQATAHKTYDSGGNVIGNYALDSSLTLRGIPKLDANNNLYYDGDTYASDGTVTRRYGVVDLGTLDWTYNSTYDFFASSYLSTKTGVANQISNILCGKYTTVASKYANGVPSLPDKSILVAAENQYIRVKDSTYTDAATLKTAMSGVYLVYELATPTTESADPYTNPQIVDPDGTEEYVTSNSVPVGHVTKYPEDLRSKIEGLPWDLSMIAPIENGTTASKAYLAGQYFLKDNQFCKAKTAIASGATFTLGTNYEVTTVATELYAAMQ